MSFEQPDFWLGLGKIIWIDILLAGDNAVVIALACRSLPPRLRWWGIVLGAGVAVVLRIIFTLFVTTLLNVHGLKMAGALLLLWIAVDLIIPIRKSKSAKIEAATNLWRAVRTVALADVVMSLDNVIAIAGAARGDWLLIVLGLAISIPLVIGGAALFTKLLDRFPVLVLAGAGLLGWIAGEMFVTDNLMVAWLGESLTQALFYPAAVVGAAIVLAAGVWLKRTRGRRTVEPANTIPAANLAAPRAEDRRESGREHEPARKANLP